MIKQCRGDGNCITGRPVRKLAKRSRNEKNPKYSNQLAASNPSSNNNATKLILVECDVMQCNATGVQLKTNTMQWRPTQNKAMMECNKAMQQNAVETNAKQCSGARCNAMQLGHDMMQCNTVGHNA